MAPEVAHRQALRACAAIGVAAAAAASASDAACFGAHRAIVSFGAEAAAVLAAIPDTLELSAFDAAFAAAYPGLVRDARPRVAQRMLRLIERYRREGGLDRLDDEILYDEFGRAVALALAEGEFSSSDAT